MRASDPGDGRAGKGRREGRGGADSAEWAEDGEGSPGGKGRGHGEQSFAQLFEIVEKHPLSRLLTSETARVAFSSVPA